MDLNVLRSLATLMMFVLFIGIWVWAWGRRQQSGFKDAEMVPFIDEPAAQRTPSGELS